MDEQRHFHIETYVEGLVRSGVPHQEAKQRAKLEFGAVQSGSKRNAGRRAASIFSKLFLGTFAMVCARSH
jgi:hypothetical protein